jgi:hypothetical protein
VEKYGPAEDIAGNGVNESFELTRTKWLIVNYGDVQVVDGGMAQEHTFLA